MKRAARHAKSGVMLGLTYVAALIATLPLLLILVHLIKEGAKYIRPSLFTEMPRPVGEAGGGMANAIVGTLILISIASVIGLPIGIGAGLYLAEKRGKLVGNGRAFPVRRPEWAAVNCSGDFRMAISRATSRPFFCVGGRNGAGSDDDPAGDAHDRGNDSPRPRFACAKQLWPWATPGGERR